MEFQHLGRDAIFMGDESALNTETTHHEPGRQGPLCDGKTRPIQSKFVRDGIIGFSDGLTVPFALTAGLSALGDTKIVIIGGLAELLAGSVSMGLGTFLAAVSERRHYTFDYKRQLEKIRSDPEAEEVVLHRILSQYGVKRPHSDGTVAELRKDEHLWVRFVMDFHMKMEKPDRRGAVLEGVVMAASYLLGDCNKDPPVPDVELTCFTGGILPMIPYFVIPDIEKALWVSISIGVVILLVFGYFKSMLMEGSCNAAYGSALQTLLIGGLAAGLSYGIIKLVNSIEIEGDY